MKKAGKTLANDSRIHRLAGQVGQCRQSRDFPKSETVKDCQATANTRVGRKSANTDMVRRDESHADSTRTGGSWRHLYLGKGIPLEQLTVPRFRIRIDHEMGTRTERTDRENSANTLLPPPRTVRDLIKSLSRGISRRLPGSALTRDCK